MIKKYRKKPIVIEAIEITGPEVFPEIEEWMNGFVLKYPTEKVKVRESSKGEYNCYLNSSCIFRNNFRIGDFFVKGVDDSIYPVSKESFWKVYDEVGSKDLTW